MRKTTTQRRLPERHLGAYISEKLLSSRTILRCEQKCLCNSAANDLAIQPVNIDEIRPSYLLSEVPYEINVDIIDDFDVPLVQHKGSLRGRIVSSTNIWCTNQVHRLSDSNTATSTDEEDSIECRERLPSLNLSEKLLIYSKYYTS